MSEPTKICIRCGSEFGRGTRKSSKWAKAKMCGLECAKQARVSHGQRRTRLYGVWSIMKNRCLNSVDPQYPNYGGRGVVVCAEWRDDFEAFASAVGPDPGKGYELGRKDNDGPYAPGNVQWETRTQNMRNRRNTVWVVFSGEKMALPEACEKLGASYHRTWERLKRGWPVDKALGL